MSTMLVDIYEHVQKCVWDFPFSIPFIFNKVYSCSTKSMDFLTMKHHNFLQN